MQLKEMMFMYNVTIPQGVNVTIDGETIVIKGKLGSTSKKINKRLFTVRTEPGSVAVEISKNKKLEKLADLAAQAITAELNTAFKTVNEGIEKKMVVFFSHFPMVIEVKGKEINIKNIFGERVPRTASIVGDTKVEVKGQEVKVKGVDAYDVGQTIANIRKACYSIGDTRVFQDGVYLTKEE
jgi:large subunit ribosomal protein L6